MNIYQEIGAISLIGPHCVSMYCYRSIICHYLSTLGVGRTMGKFIKKMNLYVAGPPTKAKRPSTLPRDDPSFDLGFNSPIEDGNEQLPAKKTSGAQILKLVQMYFVQMT